jgi:RHS repeat-associated protein
MSKRTRPHKRSNVKKAAKRKTNGGFFSKYSSRTKIVSALIVSLLFAAALLADWKVLGEKVAPAHRSEAMNPAHSEAMNKASVKNVSTLSASELADIPPEAFTRRLPADVGYNAHSGGLPPGALPPGVVLPGMSMMQGGLGYGGYDGVIQQFTSKERDRETGLDYFGARYYSSTQGRFTSVDPENAGANPSDPQSWNGYAYARNNPLLYTDPEGRDYRVCSPDTKECVTYTDKEFDQLRTGGPRDGYTFKNGNIYYNGDLTATYSHDCLYCDQFIDEMARRTSLIPTATAQFGAVAALLGVTGGAGAYFLGPAATVTTLGIASRTAPLLPVVPSAIDKLQKLGISPERASAIVQSPASQKLIDNANNGNINHVQEVGGKLIRITTDPSGQRIISAGMMRANQITNGIAKGRYTIK